MSWLEISVRVSREHAALVETLLQNEPVLALTMTDDADEPVLEPGVGETPLWPSVCVTALFSSEANVGHLPGILSFVPGIERPEQVFFRTFEDEQWELTWLDRFKPMQFGSGLWVVPGELTAPDGAVYVVRLDPGLAFGTGTHPTTRLCLQWMDRHDFKGQTVVDYGCGSGVLGVAAAVMGAKRVLCVDNDPQALTATRENAARNGISAVVDVYSPGEQPAVQAQVVLANILAGPLIELAPDLGGMLAPGGQLVLSGVLEHQADEVVEAYRLQGVQMLVTVDEGWVLLEGTVQPQGKP